MRSLRWLYTGWDDRARRFGNWTGFREKTLIDYIQLIVLPFVLIVGGQLVSQAVNASARAQALEDAQERRLQDYLGQVRGPGPRPRTARSRRRRPEGERHP